MDVKHALGARGLPAERITVPAQRSGRNATAQIDDRLGHGVAQIEATAHRTARGGCTQHTKAHPRDVRLLSKHDT